MRQREKYPSFEMRVSGELMRAIDDWRAARRPVLSRGAAMRALAIHALESDKDVSAETILRSMQLKDAYA